MAQTHPRALAPALASAGNVISWALCMTLPFMQFRPLPEDKNTLCTEAFLSTQALSFLFPGFIFFLAHIIVWHYFVRWFVYLTPRMGTPLGAGPLSILVMNGPQGFRTGMAKSVLQQVGDTWVNLYIELSTLPRERSPCAPLSSMLWSQVCHQIMNPLPLYLSVSWKSFLWSHSL